MNAWMPAEPPFDPNDFSGVARLFPLPKVVSFPHVVTPLHVFEERYRVLTRAALEGDGLIAMAVLEPGWESDYAGRPPLGPVACLGKVLSHHQMSDGRFNLLLLGMRRVRLVKEVAPPQAFRQSYVELIDEVEPPTAPEADALRTALIDAIKARLAPGPAADELEQSLWESERLGPVADLAAHSLPLVVTLKQRLLAEPSAAARARLILAAAEASGRAPDTDYPPPFSDN